MKYQGRREGLVGSDELRTSRAGAEAAGGASVEGRSCHVGLLQTSQVHLPCPSELLAFVIAGRAS